MDWDGYLQDASGEVHWALIALDAFYKTTTAEEALSVDRRRDYVRSLAEKFAVAGCSEGVARGLIGVSFQLVPRDRDLRHQISRRILLAEPSVSSIVAEEFQLLGEQLPPAPVTTLTPPVEPDPARSEEKVALSPVRRSRNLKPKVAFGVVTPLDVEQAALETVFGSLSVLVPGKRDEPNIQGGKMSYLGTEVPFAVIQCRTKGEQAGFDAASYLGKKVSTKVYMVAGVGGSLATGLRPRDVAFADSGFDDSLGRETEDGFETDARSLGEVPLSVGLAFDDWVHELDLDNVEACRVAVDPHTQESFRVIKAGVSSGNVLLDAGQGSQYRASISGAGRHNSKFIEMEFAGVLKAVRQLHGRAIVPVAMFRGISDEAKDKSKESQLIAGRRAMQCLCGYVPYLLHREDDKRWPDPRG